VELIKVTQNGRDYYLDVDQLTTLVTTEQLHRKALFGCIRSLHEQAEQEGGKRLQHERECRAIESSDTREDDMATDTTTGKTPQKGTLAALVAERVQLTTKAPKVDSPITQQLQAVVMTDQGRDPVTHRENMELAVTEDGKLAILVDVSAALKPSDAGWGTLLASTRWTSSKTGHRNKYYRVTENLAIQLNVVLLNTPVGDADIQLDLRNGTRAGKLNI